jgi:hypothetical protein
MNTYEPLVDVPAETVTAMRAKAPRNAFLAAMLDLIRRNGGLTQHQLDMVRKEVK